MFEDLPKVLTNELYMNRIFGLIKDYDINIRDAIIWDMMGFEDLSNIFSEAVEEYLIMNNLTDGYAALYRDIINGVSMETIDDDEV